jgi:hypothetical protein
MNMESKIEKLLHKYWDTNSSIEEENQLKALLNDASDSDELANEKELFAYFQNEKSLELDESFDEEILGLIEVKEETKVFKFSDFAKRYSSIAAALLVLFVSSYIFMQQQQSFVQEDSFDNPEAAYKEFKKQMLMVSQMMNKGSETVSELNNLGKFDEVVNEIGTMERASATVMSDLSELNRTN